MKWLAHYDDDCYDSEGYLRYDPEKGKAYWFFGKTVFNDFKTEHGYDWEIAEHPKMNDPTRFILLCPQEMMETMT